MVAWFPHISHRLHFFTRFSTFIFLLSTTKRTATDKLQNYQSTQPRAKSKSSKILFETFEKVLDAQNPLTASRAAESGTRVGHVVAYLTRIEKTAKF